MTETWTAKGCYYNTGKALGDILMKVGSYGTVNKRMDACKDKADTEGVTLFGLDNKRCWTGTDGENTYDKFGSSAQCKEVDGNKMGYFTSESIAIYKKNNGKLCIKQV